MRHYLTLSFIFLSSALLLLKNESIGQANFTLSNLASPTSVNQSLLPNVDNTRNLGSATRQWRHLFVGGDIHVGGLRFIRKYLHNILIGSNNSGGALTTGIWNVVVGEGALVNATDASYNVAIGLNSLQHSVGGFENIAIGLGTLGTNVSGNTNVAIGSLALFNSTTSSQVALGFRSLYSNTSGERNTAIGNEVLRQNTTGIDNTAVGFEALLNNSSGRANSAYGVRALHVNTTGIENTAFGYQTLMSSTSSFNTGFGTNALRIKTSGTANTGIGWSTLNAITTQSFNTALGYNAGATRTVASGTFIGALAQANASGFSNVVAVGFGATVTASNQVRIGNTSMTSIGGFRAWSNLSDGRFKKNVQENVPGIEFLMSLRPITYILDMDALNKSLSPKTKNDPELISPEDPSKNAGVNKVVQTGFIAQEVEEAAKKLGFEFSGVDAPKNENDLYALRYSEFVVPLVKAVQELVQKNNDLEERVIELEKLLADRKGPSKGSIGQNFPNPFTSTTVIRYSLPDNATNAKLELTNAKGQLIRTYSLPGNGGGQLQISKGTLAAGNYYYTLWINGEKDKTRKMIIAK